MSLLPVEGLASKRTSSCHLPVRARVIAWSGLGAADWARQGGGVEAKAMKAVAASSEEAFIVLSANPECRTYLPPFDSTTEVIPATRGHCGDPRSG